ncbi:hypothetical protein WME90_28710 [Sorangium sp. So ce375]|uniref:right-handed parallel beta-helix repeat-containing protein n=1 Tax=Sorangium sp. So ce375 TaxID=3133306 RepID=UPI003F5C33B2
MTTTVDTMTALRALPPPAGPPPGGGDTFVELLGYRRPGDGGGGFFRWDATATTVDNGGTVIRPGGAPVSGRWLRVVSGPLSVLWFGAYNDGTHAADTRAAIQATIDAMTNAAAPSHTTGAVYFPGRLGDVGEYAIDASIVLPRVPYFGGLRIFGDGKQASQLSAAVAVPIFVPDQNAANTNFARWTIEHIALATGGAARAFEFYTPAQGPVGTPLPSNGLVARGELHFDEVLFATSSGSAVDGLVFIRGGSRCRLRNCEFYGMSGTGPEDTKVSGVGILLDYSSGTVIENCRNIGVPGALLRADHSGELWVANCRCEGGYGRPAWEFIGVKNATLMNLANEGERESPSLFRFVDCDNIVLVNPQLATADGPWNGGYPDGIRFENCRQCIVISPVVPISFADSFNNGTARIVRIDAASRNIQVRGLTTTHAYYDTEVECLGQDCFIEAQTATRGMVGRGRAVLDAVRAPRGALGPPTSIVDHPPGFDLEIGGGDGATPGTHHSGHTFVQLGAPVANATASMYFSAGATNFLRIWKPTAERALVQSIGGVGLHVEGQTSLGIEGHTDVSIGSHANMLIQVSGTLSIRHDTATCLTVNATGIGFYGAAPVAKPTVTGSRSSGAALADLLAKLTALGLINNGTTP